MIKEPTELELKRNKAIDKMFDDFFEEHFRIKKKKATVNRKKSIDDDVDSPSM